MSLGDTNLYDKQRTIKTASNPRNVRILDLFEEGNTLQSIGDEFGLTRERVRQIVKAFNVETRSEAYQKRIDNLKATLLGLHQRNEQLRSSGQEEGLDVLSVRNVSRILNISELMTRRLFNELNLKPERVKKYSDEEVLEAAEKVRNGMSIAKASRGDRYFAHVIGDYAREHGIKIHHSKWQDFSERKELIIKLKLENRTWEEIAEEVSKLEGRTKTHSTIYQWARRHIPDLFVDVHLGGKRCIYCGNDIYRTGYDHDYHPNEDGLHDHNGHLLGDILMTYPCRDCGKRAPAHMNKIEYETLIHERDLRRNS